GFARRGAGHLEASLTLEEPKDLWGRVWRILVGAPIHSELEIQERLPKKKALAVFSSDALSSVAYAPQATLVVLLAAGASAIFWSLPISIAIVALLAAVVFSYRQTIYAYPNGGGSYIVAHENLGEIPGLIAAAALSVGYILTVSVSIASAVDQLVSAVQPLASLRILLGIAAVALVTLANLRGIRESGSIFAAPTYVFLAAMFTMIGAGLFLYLTGQFYVPPPPELPPPTEPLTLFLLLRAFAVGSAVMTGTEAISNGIPAFKPPESRNAAHTIVTMAVILALIFLFGGSTGALLPLYAVAVFTAFTLSQSGMVEHWRRLKGHHWQLKASVNGIGAVATGLVTVIAATTGFMDPSLPIIPGLPIGWGSWLVLVIVPLYIWLLLTIKSHYREAALDTELPATPDPLAEKPLHNVVVVPIARLNRPAIQALRYAQSLSPEVTAVHVATDPDKADEIEAAWRTWGRGVPLTIVESPYRSLTRPLLQYLAELKRLEKAETVTVVLPEYVPDSIWQHLLHGQSAQFLKLSLLFTPGFVVTSVPVHPEVDDILPTPKESAQARRNS